MKCTNSALTRCSGTRRHLLTAAVLCLFLLPSTAQQQQKPRGGKGDVGKPVPASPSEPFVIGEQHFGAAEERDSPKNQAQDRAEWFRPPVWSNWALVLAAIWAGRIGLKTLRAIREQTQETSRSAKAAEDSAAFLLQSERAWLTVTVENPEEPPEKAQFVWIEVPIANRGKTPARIKSVLATSKLVPIPPNAWTGRPGELPKEPDYSDANKLVPITEIDIIIAPTDSLRHVHVFIFPEEWKKVRRRELSLYVYGYVEYFDTIRGLEHETRFCSIYWVPQAGYNEPTGFMFSQIIPAAYFRAT